MFLPSYFPHLAFGQHTQHNFCSYLETVDESVAVCEDRDFPLCIHVVLNSFIITKFIDRSIYVNMLCDYWLFPHSSGIVCPRQGGEDMRSIIEELYYGNIAPADRDVVKGGEYSKLMHLLTRNEEDLEGTLTQA